jgi:hypothetical protein
MPEDIYNRYIENIRTYLKSEKAQLFSPAAFDKVLFEACADTVLQSPK